MLSFDIVRQQRPAKLFIVADGPRPSHSTDVERCAAVREIVGRVDWPCEVYRKYAESNLGLKVNVSEGLSWVFEEVEHAIVLEDDCLAHVDFFRFCNELLKRYENDERVSVITGNNFQGGRQRGEAAYYFSRYNHCWGWATWRRAWQYYQGSLPFWPKWSDSRDWSRQIPDVVERKYWAKVFRSVFAGQVDSWAYPWTASVWYRGGLTATPNVNLVSNIGFGLESTHTTAEASPLANMPTSRIGNLQLSPAVVRDEEADGFVFDHVFGGRLLRFPYSLMLLPRRIASIALRQLKRALLSVGFH
ncbi:MAG: glycosyltransferase family 2 protein [Halioglobus sp.]|nr:glycosyltransferase family 2 protein [Halioglobus sp.]